MKKKELKKTTKSTTKNGCISHIEQPSLTPTEKIILHMVTKDFCTMKELCFRRKCTQQAISKHLISLREKGYLTIANQMVVKSQWGGTTNNQIHNQKRLHAQEFNIKILFKDEKYKNIRERANILNLDGNVIRLYRDSIEIYSGQSFGGDTSQKATSQSLVYWNKFFARLENELKIIFVKPRSQNILMVKHEYGNPGSQISEAMDHKPIKLYAKEDGKLWFSMDNSWNLREHETHHKETAKQDDEVIDKHLRDWRDKNPPTLSEVMCLFKEQAEHNKETSAGLLAVSEYMKSQIPKKSPESLKTSKQGSYIG